MHDVFSDWCRRAILYHLEGSDGPVAVRDVCKRLAAWSRDDAANPADEPEAVDEVRSWLLRTHVLPMDAFGVVEYHPDDDAVRIPDDVAISVDPPWERPEADRPREMTDRLERDADD